jgi:hypothetical protein
MEERLPPHAEVHVEHAWDLPQGATQKGGDPTVVRQDIEDLLDQQELAEDVSSEGGLVHDRQRGATCFVRNCSGAT